MRDKVVFLFVRGHLERDFWKMVRCSYNIPAIWLNQCWWRNWLPSCWALQGDLTTCTTQHDFWPLCGLFSFCQRMIFGRTNIHCQKTFLCPAGSSSPGPSNIPLAWLLSRVYTWFLSLLSGRSLVVFIYLLPWLFGSFSESRETFALPFGSFKISAWSFTFCRCSMLII